MRLIFAYLKDGENSLITNNYFLEDIKVCFHQPLALLKNGTRITPSAIPEDVYFIERLSNQAVARF